MKVQHLILINGSEVWGLVIEVIILIYWKGRNKIQDFISINQVVEINRSKVKVYNGATSSGRTVARRELPGGAE